MTKSSMLNLFSGVYANYEVPERYRKTISTGTPFRLIYGVIHLQRPQENQAFEQSYTCVHMRLTSSAPLGTSTCCRHKIHITLCTLNNDLPDLKPKFDYNMIVIYLKLLLVIYITNLY